VTGLVCFRHFLHPVYITCDKSPGLGPQAEVELVNFDGNHL